jgi:hypothetical protein
MARAGSCSACGKNVYLTESGGCSAGHGPESISGHYEAPDPTPAPVVQTSPQPTVQAITQPAAAAVQPVPSPQPGARVAGFSKLPVMVQQELAKLPPEKQTAFMDEYRRRCKSSGIAYVLWFFLGLHYAYLGKWGLQVLYWLTIGGVLIWAFADLFRIPGMIGNYNKDRAVEVMSSLKTMAG